MSDYKITERQMEALQEQCREIILYCNCAGTEENANEIDEILLEIIARQELKPAVKEIEGTAKVEL